ncbi:SusC/RagA family TonB-linked outer membrane protein [Niabella drilacis]|uniref:Iron complex outermembrane recepter protein n=1 Tax=Niabella drilacis (strain DSM 25811 / CCM 8410 / CCUG 62505 / LMG 26954 / E90) TaxID=1285928 RepID=A0A1G6PTH3_NIADE|nr:SusC/RagA family TonB-linked outer membrane protein [Niabella drilacis]SDC83338.1 iron complex outermembrane recepter protein [Niabella drilacis]
MQKKHVLLVFFALLLSCGSLLAQVKRTITGMVTDDTGAAIPGASVIEKGTANGVAADEQGRFTITVAAAATLGVSAAGFETTELKPGSTGEVAVTLKSAVKSEGEVVVTALGISKQKRQLGFAVTEVKGDDLAKTNEVNPINALQGRVAGVQIDMGGAGGLMANSKIIIRGNSTLGNNNQPIFVIDGVIMDNDQFGGKGRDFGNDLKNLNMEDFESVSVLKGSSAAALYGSRAVNGVILITTKKGKQRKGVGISVNHSLSISDPYAGPKFQNEFGGGTVGDFFTDARDPNYKSTERWTTKVFPTDPVTGKPYIDRGIGRELENWGPRMLGQDVINYDGTMTKYLPQPNNFLDVFQKGIGNNTNVAIDGGTDRSTFRFSYNHNQTEGVVSNNRLSKNAFDLRATHKFTSFLDMDVSVAYSDFMGYNPPSLGGTDAFASYNFGKLYSWMLPRNYDTKYWMQKEHYTSQFGGVPNPATPGETNLAPETRFWFSLFENNYIQKEQMLRGRVAFTIKLTDWASLVLDGNINNIYTRNETKELGQGVGFTGGSYALGFKTKESNMQKWMLMMNKDINPDLSINGYIGGEAQRYKTTFENSATNGGLSYPGNYFLANSVLQPTTSGGIRDRKTLNSLYASADIAYKNMLFLQATWRGDWSSALTYTDGTGNNFYNYPAVSLAWIFTEMLKESKPEWISYGKFRANIAALGGDTDPFKINTGFAFSGYSTAGGNSVPLSTYSSSSVLQPNLQPQRKIAKELGMEMRFLKSRVGFDVSLYQDNTRNQLLDITTPVESGVNTIFINAGNIQNKGIEVSIDGTPVKGKNFSWNTALTYAVNRNKIVDLYPGRTEYNLQANIGEISTWAVVGKSYGVLRTQIHSTAFQAVDGNGKPVADPRNGLPILAWRSDSRTAFPARSNTWQDVGDINAKFRSGWDNTFTYKNFSLNVLLDAKIGGDFVALSYRYGTHTGVFPNTLPGRDAQNGGIVWTSKYANDGGTYDDGIIPQGVFAPGQKVDKPGGGTADVGGMTYQEAYDKGLVEPSHLPQFYYRYGSSSTGVSDYWILKNSWISMRQVALSYNVSPRIYERLKLRGLSVSAVGRNLMYLYNTLPYNFNPESNNSNNTAYSGEEGFLPMVRNFVFTIRAAF